MKTLRELVIDGIRSNGDPYFWRGEYDRQPCWQHVKTARENAEVAFKAALESLSDEDLYDLFNRASDGIWRRRAEDFGDR